MRGVGTGEPKKGQPGDGRVSASPVPSWACLSTAQPRGGKNEKEYLKRGKKTLIGVWAEVWGVLWCVRAVLGSDSKFLGLLLSAAVPEHPWC